MYELKTVLIIDPSSGASIGVPVNSFQLARSGKIPKHV
jgi:hypothetical protein